MPDGIPHPTAPHPRRPSLLIGDKSIMVILSHQVVITCYAQWKNSYTESINILSTARDSTLKQSTFRSIPLWLISKDCSSLN